MKGIILKPYCLWVVYDASLRHLSYSALKVTSLSNSGYYISKERRIVFSELVKFE